MMEVTKKAFQAFQARLNRGLLAKETGARG
jgi:hypothetical protein